jgi:integrase
MAHIEDRWYKTVVVDGKATQVPKPGCGQGMRYRVRYLDPAGKERSESFPDRRKREAQAFLARIQADILKGAYIDPDAGKTTFRRYATEWLKSATSDQNTRDRLARQFRLHVYPEFGDRPLLAIQPATLRAWLRRLTEGGLAASYQRILFNDVSMIFNAAVDDKLIPGNPFAVKTVHTPRYVPAKVIPWPVDRLAKFRAEVRDRYRISVDLGSGCGLRQGEIFGASPDDVDPTRPVLHVVRQVKIVRQRLIFAPPKGGKVREVPLPGSVLARLRAHAAEYPPIAVTLPWATLDGDPRTVPLYLTTATGDALTRPRFNANVWKPAIRAAGIEDDRRNGMHVLRHTYASVLLDAGESIKALSLYLGHADPGFTLRVYTHLLPSSEDRTRRAIDKAFGYRPDTRDGLETA